jgi:hypothetical protein
MATVPVRNLGAVGIIKDPDPTSIPPSAFSDGLNVRFNDAKVERAPIFRKVFSIPTSTYNPLWCYGVFTNHATFDTIIYCNRGGGIYKIFNGAQTDITDTGHVFSNDDRAGSGGSLAGCIYINQPNWVPRVLTPGAVRCVVLPNWNSTWRCGSLRMFGSQLVALNVTKGATNYPLMVLVSDTVTYGNYPVSWDATDTTKLAVENTLSQATTPIVDGGVLGRDFMIYTSDEVWKMVNNSGQLMFDFHRLPFDNVGLINQNCFVEVDGKHFAWSDTDIYMHDGVSKTSLLDQRNRSVFFKELNMTYQDAFFVAHDKRHNEVLFCGVSNNSGLAIPPVNSFCNYAAVYNYRDNTWSFRDVPNVSAAATANVNALLSTYNLIDSSFTYANTGGAYTDQDESYSRFCVFLIGANTSVGISEAKLDVLDFADKGKLSLPVDPDTVANPVAWVEHSRSHFEEAGADLRSYKLVRAVLPMGSATDPDASLSIQLAGDGVWNVAQPWNPRTDYKVDTRVTGRYITTRFTMSSLHDFSLAGYDFDVIVTGRR